jgi:acyl carrier protein
MIDQDRIRDILFEAVKEANVELPPDSRLPLSIDTVLFGVDGRLDSIGLVSFVLSVEERLHDAFPYPLSLSDERAMSQRNSPFRSLRTLQTYVVALLEEHMRPDSSTRATE